MQRQQQEGRPIPDLEQLTPETRAQFQHHRPLGLLQAHAARPGCMRHRQAYRPWQLLAACRRWPALGPRGLAFLGDVGGGLAIGMRRFWEKYPTSLEISGASGPAATMTMWFWSPEAQPMDLRHYGDVIGHDGTISYEDHEDGFSTPFGVANTSELTLWA